jgi:hypothetical protein
VDPENTNKITLAALIQAAPKWFLSDTEVLSKKEDASRGTGGSPLGSPKSPLARRKLTSNSSMEVARKLFKDIDTQQRGKINLKDIQVMLTKLGQQHRNSDKELKELFATLDTDSDGTISFIEFKSGMEQIFDLQAILVEESMHSTVATKSPALQVMKNSSPNTSFVNLLPSSPASPSAQSHQNGADAKQYEEAIRNLEERLEQKSERLLQYKSRMDDLEAENALLKSHLKDYENNMRKLLEENEELKKQQQTQSQLIQLLYTEEAQLMKQLEKWKVQIQDASQEVIITSAANYAQQQQ